MALQQKARGFIFKKEDRLEADRMLTFYTDNLGRVEVLAKGIRKIDAKLRGGAEVFSISDIEFIQGRNQKTLTDAVKVKNFKNIMESPEKTKFSHKILRALDLFIKGQESDKKIWELLVDVFEKVNDVDFSRKNYNLINCYFIWNFMDVLGYSPHLSVCASCGQKLNPYNLYFSNKDGGVVCKNCAAQEKNSGKINSDIVKIIRIFLGKDWQTIMKLKVDSASTALLKKISDDYYSYILSCVSPNNLI